MIEGLITLAWYGGSYTGGQFGDLFNQLENTGFFSYVLPFLLIFAVVFGILSRMNLFSKDQEKSNNGVNAIIALAVALLALQFGVVPQFFSEVFPQLGVGLSIVLLMIVLMGFFVQGDKWPNYVFFGIGAIIFIIIVVKSTQSFGFYSGGGYIWDQYGFSIIVIALLIAAVIWAFVSNSTSNPKHS